MIDEPWNNSLAAKNISRQAPTQKAKTSETWITPEWTPAKNQNVKPLNSNHWTVITNGIFGMSSKDKPGLPEYEMKAEQCHSKIVEIYLSRKPMKEAKN